jgi:peptide/nickel transport system substrate-binding protein
MQRVTPRRTATRTVTWRRIGAAAAVVALLSTSACRSSSGSAAPAPVRGGTLTVYLSTHAISNLDPQGISWAVDASFSRLLNRTLTTTTSDGQLIPDLATDTGRPKDNNTVWDFTLKPGLKWQDGSPVTCNDVKYGIERRFAPIIGKYQGLPYPLLYLKDNPKPYQGPFDGQGLDSIQCQDQRNVEFHLSQAAGDFGYTVSVNTFAPVKVGSDGKDKLAYNFDPTANGPYKVDVANTHVDKKNFNTPSLTQLTLVRNPFWSPATDSVRKAYPDEIVAKWTDNNSQTTNDLINSTGDFANSIGLDGDASPNFVQQIINDPELSKRVLQANTTGVRYFAINTKRVQNVECRKALEYGFDKRSFRFVLGGATAGGLATSMIPPGIPAHENFDLYETNDFPDGDYQKAAKMVTDNKCKTTLRVAYPDLPIYHQLLSTVVEAYQRIGVEVDAIPVDHAQYQFKIADPKNDFDMVVSGWVPDWPNGSGVIPTLFNGAQTTGDASQNLNYAMLNDPDINSAIKAANSESKLQVQYRLWGDLDRQIMSKAAVIPVLYIGALRLYGSNVRGVTLCKQYGQPDLAVMGLGSVPNSG